MEALAREAPDPDGLTLPYQGPEAWVAMSIGTMRTSFGQHVARAAGWMSRREGLGGPVALATFLVAALPAHGYEARHPVFPAHVPPEQVAHLRGDVAAVMQFGPEQIAAFVPARTSHYNIDCPNCEAGNPQRVGWVWSADDPERITCGYCGMVFPNDRYPLDRVTTVTDATGLAHDYAYWEGRNGYKHYIQMHVDYRRKAYMERSAGRIARLYAVTGEAQYARQAALILHRLAEVYPHYSVHGITDYTTCAPVIYDLARVPAPADGLQPVPGLAKDLDGYRTPYPYCSTLRGDGIDNWFYDEMCPHLAQAYDLVAGSDELDRLSAATQMDCRKQIEDFFRATANYARTFPIYMGNMDPELITGLAVIGRVIGEPEFVHDALRRAKLILGWQFYADGIWREAAPSYHEQTVHGLRDCIEHPLKGYSDPEGYTNPVDGTHIARLDAAADAPMLRESQEALARMRMPNGDPITVHDTWPQVTQGEPVSPVRDEPVGTHLMWAMGQAVLGLGRGATGVQASLHFSGAYGHEHSDNLDLMLFGAGREMLSDIGYTHTVLRPLAESSLGHNLVVVDQGDQQGADGALEAWGVHGDLLRFCEARAEGAYPQVTQYRRALAAVALPGGGAYVVHVFRVAGGSTHDWLVHGSADYSQRLECALALHPLHGTLLPPSFDRPFPWVEASGQGFDTVVDGVHVLYGLLGDLRQGRGDGTWSATFRYAQSDTPALRTTVLGQPGVTVYAATLPSIRPARESSAQVLAHRMPVLLVRRQGSHLHSIFAAVHEPYEGLPRVGRVEPLVLRAGGSEAIGVACEGDGFRDYHLFGAEASQHSQAVGVPLEATARYAFVRTVGDQVERMVLVDGTHLAFGGAELALPPAPAGTVLAVRRAEAGDGEDALIVDVPIPPRHGLPHERVLVEFGDRSTYGLAVHQIRAQAGGQSVIVLEHRPGFALSADGGAATHTHHPHHQMRGRPRFRLVNVAGWERR
ncbi:MAG: hypothetical protein AB1505_04045 [Candidatus Latescibacterota bacterium]